MTNKYDVILIDEAHEHNKNIDLSLTLLKYALYYNN
jgi:HrpA-like RNA helicase